MSIPSTAITIEKGRGGGEILIEKDKWVIKPANGFLKSFSLQMMLLPDAQSLRTSKLGKYDSNTV